MKYPTVTYKAGYTVTLEDHPTLKDRSLLTVAYQVPDAKDPSVSFEARWERSCETRFLHDRRFLTHWVTGVLCEMEVHESKHWLRIDGEGVK